MKLANFESFIASMLLDQEPPVKHFTIDNRLSVPHSLQEQLQVMLSSEESTIRQF
jgi:hypothetical protein